MSLRSSRLLLAAGLLLPAFAPGAAEAAGYAVNDRGARAMAQGLTGVATLDGPEVVVESPAGVAEFPQWSLAVGTTLLDARFESVPEETGARRFDSGRDRFVVPHAHAAGPARGRWAWGLSVTSPFGLATEWPADFPGRFVSRIAELETVQLSTVIAARLPRGWSIGFGPTMTHGDVRLSRQVDLSPFRNGHEGTADLTGDGWSPGFRAGARWRSPTGWSFGVVAQPDVDLEFDGRVDYTVPPIGSLSLDEALMALFIDGPAATTLTLPASVTAGFGRVHGPWTWEAALSWTHWSVMERVVVDLEPIVAEDHVFVPEEVVTNLWHDVLALRLGARRRVGDHWSWAAGIYLDPSPVPRSTGDPLLPDSDRLSATAGLTWRRGAFALDLAAQLVRFDGLDTRATGNRFPSRYDAGVAAVGATLGWTFGK